MRSNCGQTNNVVRETGTGIVRETGTGIVRETGTGIVRETGTGIAKTGWLTAAVLAFVIPMTASATVYAPVANSYMVATPESDAGGQVMLNGNAGLARLSWFATLDNGAKVILSGFGRVKDNVLKVSLFGLCSSIKAVEAGTGDKAVEAGTGDKAVEAGTGDKAVEAGTGSKTAACSVFGKAVEAGTGDKAVEAGTGDKAVEAGTGDKAVEAGTGDKAVEAGTGDKAVEAGTGDKRATYMGTFEGILECGTLSGFYTGPAGGNSMFVEFTAPGPRSLSCGMSIAIQ